MQNKFELNDRDLSAGGSHDVLLNSQKQSFVLDEKAGTLVLNNKYSKKEEKLDTYTIPRNKVCEAANISLQEKEFVGSPTVIVEKEREKHNNILEKELPVIESKMILRSSVRPYSRRADLSSITLKCHYCKSDDKSNEYLSCYNLPKCKTSFCFACLKAFFYASLTMEPAQYRLEKWECLVCRRLCHCERCVQRKIAEEPPIRKEIINSEEILVVKEWRPESYLSEEKAYRGPKNYVLPQEVKVKLCVPKSKKAKRKSQRNKVGSQKIYYSCKKSKKESESESLNQSSSNKKKCMLQNKFQHNENKMAAQPYNPTSNLVNIPLPKIPVQNYQSWPMVTFPSYQGLQNTQYGVYMPYTIPMSYYPQTYPMQASSQFPLQTSYPNNSYFGNYPLEFYNFYASSAAGQRAPNFQQSLTGTPGNSNLQTKN